MQPQMPQKHIPKSCSVAEKFSDRVIRAASNQLIKVINRLQSTEVRGSTVCHVCLRESSQTRNVEDGCYVQNTWSRCDCDWANLNLKVRDRAAVPLSLPPAPRPSP
jgi:hypothetical protein